jgi:hypothetical protein
MRQVKSKPKTVLHSIAEVKKKYFPKAYAEENSEQNRRPESRRGSGFSKEIARIFNQ